MARRAVPPSFLPSLIMPCPCCGHRMVVKVVAAPKGPVDFEEITHVCKDCGTELTRTVSARPGEAAA